MSDGSSTSDPTPPITPNLKPYTITNNKSYVPLILDLNELNYDAWRELFHTHCVGFGVSGHLDGSIASKGPDDSEWITLDAIVRSWIYGTLTQPLLNMILLTSSTPTAQSFWSDLERLFRDNREARAIGLDNEIRSLEMGDQSVTEYCQRLKVLSDLLRNIGQPVPARTLVTHLINGLSPKFEKILPVIQHHNPPFPFLRRDPCSFLKRNAFSDTRPLPLPILITLHHRLLSTPLPTTTAATIKPSSSLALPVRRGATVPRRGAAVAATEEGDVVLVVDVVNSGSNFPCRGSFLHEVSGSSRCLLNNLKVVVKNPMASLVRLPARRNSPRLPFTQPLLPQQQV